VEIVRQIGIVLARIGFGHQYFDVPPNELVGDITEQPLGRVADRADRTGPVDDDNGVDRGSNDRAVKGIA
jgi:hypothetical protein